jgi:hypothetical protein
MTNNIWDNIKKAYGVIDTLGIETTESLKIGLNEFPLKIIENDIGVCLAINAKQTELTGGVGRSSKGYIINLSSGLTGFLNSDPHILFPTGDEDRILRLPPFWNVTTENQDTLFKTAAGKLAAGKLAEMSTDEKLILKIRLGVL